MAELAPLAGVYPTLKLGPAWWFFDSVYGMQRSGNLPRKRGFTIQSGSMMTPELCSIPARHDVARRVDCTFLTSLVMTGCLREYELLTWRRISL